MSHDNIHVCVYIYIIVQYFIKIKNIEFKYFN